MSLQSSSLHQKILLLFIACFYFSVYDVGIIVIQAATDTACSKDQHRYMRCREINADCYPLKNADYECLCSEGFWMLDGKCQKSDWCAAGEIGDIVCKSNGTVCTHSEWTSDSQTRPPYKCICESKVVQSRICSVTQQYCLSKEARSLNFRNITLCECDQRSFFDYSASKCKNMDLCPFKECKGKYEQCEGGKCTCNKPYEGNPEAGEKCRPINYCLTDNRCGSAKCEEGPEDDPKRIRCYCDNGFVLHRKNSVPYCKMVKCDTHSLNPCDHICTPSKDKMNFRCECFPGHTLQSDGISCVIQPSYKCDFNVCNPKSICIKLDDESQCMCKNSLIPQSDNATCVDRCAAGRLQDTCPGECKSTENGFQCICRGKYRLSKNKVTCEERQMCLEGEEGFSNCSQQNRSCVERPDTEPGFACDKCLHDLQEHEENCTDLCQLDENKRYCEEKGATCISVNEDTHEVKCKCSPFLTWKKNVGCVFARHSYTGELRIFDSYKNEEFNNSSRGLLRYGEDGIDWKKLDHDIGKSMSTLFGQALSQVNVLQCRPDHLAENHELCIVCAIELQLYFEDYGILERLNASYVCRGTSRIPFMYCFIPPYLKLVPRHPTQNVDVSFRKSNACGLSYGLSVCPASTECVHEDVGFSCRCKEGFAAKRTVFLNSDKTGIIEICEDVNECDISDPCPNGTECINKQIIFSFTLRLLFTYM